MPDFVRSIIFDPGGELLEQYRTAPLKTLECVHFSLTENNPELETVMDSLARLPFADATNDDERQEKAQSFFYGGLLAIKALDVSAMSMRVPYDDFLKSFCAAPGFVTLEPALRNYVVPIADRRFYDIRKLRVELVYNFETLPDSHCDSKRLGRVAELGLCHTAVQLAMIEQTLLELATADFEHEIATILDMPEL